MKNTTKADLTREASQTSGRAQIHVAEVINQFLQTVSGMLAEGKTIEIRGFGTFEPVTRKARKGVRNPRTGEECSPLPKRRVAVFRPTIGLKQAVNTMVGPWG